MRTLTKTDAKLTSKKRRHECYEKIMKNCINIKKNPDDWEEDACDIYVALSNNGKGYGRIQWKGKKWYPHRLMWVLIHGPIPKGYDIHHTCGNKKCCNINHMVLMKHHHHSQLHNKTKDVVDTEVKTDYLIM